MPNKAKTHTDSRGIICCVCWRKCEKNGILVSKAIEDQVKLFVFKNYSSCNESYPNSICATCRLSLKEMEKVI